MTTVLRYTRGDELEPVAITWYEPDGTLYDFSSGWTWRARIGTGSGFLVEKTTGFTGAATAPNLSINFTAGELDGVASGTYHLDVQATLTATTQTITRTWMFQVLAGVGTDTLPQNPTSLAVLGDLTAGPAVIANGSATGGQLTAHNLQLPWTYTQSTNPTDRAIGTALNLDVDVTLTGPSGNAQFQSPGLYGPPGIINYEGLIRYSQNASVLQPGPVGFLDLLTTANVGGNAIDLAGAAPVIVARSILADNATCELIGGDVETTLGLVPFSDSSVYATVDSGTLDGVTNNYTHASFLSMLGLAGNTSLKRRIGLYVKAAYPGIHPLIPNPTGSHWSGAGNYDTTTTPQLDEEIGIRIQKFTLGTAKIGIQSAHPIELLTDDITHTGIFQLVHTVTGKTLTLQGANTCSFDAFNISHTIVFDDNSNPFGSASIFNAVPIIKNVNGEARTIGIGTGVSMAPTIRGDGAAVTSGGFTAFSDTPTFDVANSGTVAATAITGLRSAPLVATGATATTRKGVDIADPGGAGTITTQVGVDVAALARAGTNIGIRNASTEVATPSVATITGASSTITPNAKTKRLDNTSGGAVTLTSTPTIADGQDGQILVLFNGSANSVTLTHGTANNLRLDGGTNKALPQRASIVLMFSTTVGDWIQQTPVVTPT